MKLKFKLRQKTPVFLSMYRRAEQRYGIPLMYSWCSLGDLVELSKKKHKEFWCVTSRKQIKMFKIL